MRNFARPAAKRFKAVALHLCDWPWVVKLRSIPTHGVPEKIAQKAGTTDRGLRPGSLFSKLVQVQVVASDFLHTQLDLKRRSNEVQVECSMQHCNTSVFKEKGSCHMEPTGWLQRGHSNMFSLFGCTMLQATRSDLLNPSRGIWWFHLLRACIPPCGTGAMMQDACKSRKCIDQQRACL